MPDTELIFYLLLLLVAFLYAAVGHGGASGYLALMSFYSFEPGTMRSSALLLNIIVSLLAFLQFYRRGYFRWSLFWPFAVASIPAAFLGGRIIVEPGLYKQILGVLLLFPVIKLAGLKYKPEKKIREQDPVISILIGLIIGLFSGMIGIGGGIILSPVILLLNWAGMKQTAAVSALFIFVNSLAGLAGILTTGFDFQPETGILLAIVFTGGLAGSYFGAKKFDSVLLKRILAAVLLIAAVKLLFT